MRQTLGEFDARDEGFPLVGEERPEEYAEERAHGDRRLPTMLLTGLAMALFAGGIWFAYVQGTRHPAATAAKSDGTPLIRADQSPTKVKPDQPGGMKIPDQSVSLYNDKAGSPPVEKLLPEPEKPLPRPAAPAPAAAVLAPPAATQPAPVATLPPPAANAPAAGPAAPAAAAAKSAAKAPPQPKAASAATPATSSSYNGKVQVRLGSLRSPEAARSEWQRLKSSNPDLLGKLTAVAVRADLGEKGIYYRIEAGPFADAAAAERLCGEMKHRNLGCIVAR